MDRSRGPFHKICVLRGTIMIYFKKSAVVSGLIAAVALVGSSPAGAVVTTFAQFNQVAGAATRTVSWRQIDTGGRLCTIATASGNCPANTSTAVTASVSVNFSFLQPGIGASGPISAKLILDLIAPPGSPASTAVIGGVNFLAQPGLSGTFSIVADVPFTYNSITGTNLLSGTITGASISGVINSSSGSVNDSTLTLADPLAVQFSSQFLDFSQTVSRDFALTLTSLSPGIATSASGPMRTFRAATTGSFSSDPAPLVNGAVPEPASWALMLVGFGVIGAVTRRREASFA